ncbi:MAG: DUF423 domain-containing protein [Pirellulaceae bacterium]
MQCCSRDKLWLLSGAILGGLAVALGAFGAHGLKSMFREQGLSAGEIDRLLANWNTAAHYQLIHAVALLAIGLLAARRCGLAVHLAGAAMTLGTLIFSGCLYALVLTGLSTIFGRIVPIGGVLLIVGWVALAVAAWRDSPSVAKPG